MEIRKKLWPIKAHFFFFMAASGPILPYLSVYGKQLGISEVVMGSITAAVPITFLLAKPIFGFVADYFYERRKVIFVTLIVSMSTCYLGLYFIPPINVEFENLKADSNTSQFDFCNFSEVNREPSIDSVSEVKCNVSCGLVETTQCQILGRKSSHDFCYEKIEPKECNWTKVPSECHQKCLLHITDNVHLSRPLAFYGFIILMTLSMIFFNVGNSISDAICFDVLGEDGEKSYGYQRVWGAIGFGITAFLGGLGMDLWSNGNVKNYNTAFILVIIFTVIDVICCRKLKLPNMALSENILKDLSKVLKHRSISIFLVFAVLIGILDGFIIYFMFWFLEDLAIETDHIQYIKVLEGLTVAVETLGGEIIFFLLSRKILENLGYGHTLSLCFFNYAIRLGLISLIYNPWWILAVELLMQGPTYALSYTTIVAYTKAISPPGTSATMQGIVAGMDDGFGYALGSLIGGFLYKAVGGRMAFQIFSSLAVFCCLAHVILYKTTLRKFYNKDTSKEYKMPERIFVNVNRETNLDLQ